MIRNHAVSWCSIEFQYDNKNAVHSLVKRGILCSKGERSKLFKFSVTGQQYETHILPESVMVGNDGMLKCAVPSFVADFVSITAWVDSEGINLGRGRSGHHGKC